METGKSAISAVGRTIPSKRIIPIMQAAQTEKASTRPNREYADSVRFPSQPGHSQNPILIETRDRYDPPIVSVALAEQSAGDVSPMDLGWQICAGQETGERTIPGDCHNCVAGRTGHSFLRPSRYARRTEAGDLFNSKRVA